MNVVKLLTNRWNNFRLPNKQNIAIQIFISTQWVLVNRSHHHRSTVSHNYNRIFSMKKTVSKLERWFKISQLKFIVNSSALCLWYVFLWKTNQLLKFHKRGPTDQTIAKIVQQEIPKNEWKTLLLQSCFISFWLQNEKLLTRRVVNRINSHRTQHIYKSNPYRYPPHTIQNETNRIWKVVFVSWMR